MVTSSRKHPQRLLQTAESLLAARPNSAAFRRRAVSSAYYAAFHALASLCAKVFLVDPQEHPVELRRIYRSLDHGPVKSVFGQEPLKDNAAIRRLGNLIVGLQSARLDADYQPPDSTLFPVQQVRELIGQAYQFMDDLANLSAEDQRLLAVCLIFKAR